MTDSKGIQRNIKQAMDKLGWSRYKLASESGLSESTIYNMFARGTLPRVDSLGKICDALQVPVADVLEIEVNMKLTESDIRLLEKVHHLPSQQYARLMDYLELLTQVEIKD